MTQVSDSTKTLLDAIRDGDVPSPGLMRWNAWQTWRRGEGRRPVVSRDGVTTSNAEESALWKSVMCELYGTEWSIQLAAEEYEEAEAAPVPSAVAPPPGASSSQPLEPSLAPAEGAGSPLGPGQSVEESPGSGDARTGAAGPGSGRGTPVPSWSSQNPGTPTRLSHEIVKAYVPEKETLDRYQNRVRRQAQVLETLGDPLGGGVLEALLAKAAYELRLHEEARGDPERQLRLLKREYAFELMDIDQSEAQAGRLNALESMLEARGE